MVASFEAWANLCRLIGFAIDKQRGLAAEDRALSRLRRRPL